MIEAPIYTAADKAEMVEIMGRHRGLLTNKESKYLILRDIRGRFLSGGEVVAEGREDWIGWFEPLRNSPAQRAGSTGRTRVP